MAERDTSGIGLLSLMMNVMGMLLFATVVFHKLATFSFLAGD